LLVTLREEHRLIVFENKMLIKILGPEREEVTGDWRLEKCIMRSFVVATAHQMLLG
jgi:hypothetical protein